DDLVAHADTAGGDRACQPAEVLAGAHDELDRKAEVAEGPEAARGDATQVLQQRRPLVPGRLRRAAGDVVAEHGRDRDRQRVLEAEAGREPLELAADLR